ncbi:MAG: alpha/beta fold hydrolase [Caldilineaceae bacterium]
MTVTARANPDRVKIDWALTVTSIAEKGTTLLNAMEEMRMNPVHPLGEQAKQSRRRRLGYRFHSKRLLKWLGILLFALVLLGVAFQTIATRIDNLSYGPRGQLYTVNGRQMHMVCLGQSRAGEPTVILQAGGANESLWWVRVQSQLADHVRVCAYDRAGLGWSDPADTPRDPATIIGELHDLLAAADIQPPYVMAGHSFGAILTRVYAAHYPNEVAGIALVDGMPLELKGLSAVEFARYRWPSYAVQMPFWVIYHLGVGRLWVARSTEAMGYPPAIARNWPPTRCATKPAPPTWPNMAMTPRGRSCRPPWPPKIWATCPWPCCGPANRARISPVTPPIARRWPAIPPTA